MDVFTFPSILRRWWWVLASVVAVALAGIGAQVATAPTTYETRVRVQITAPQFEDLSLFDNGNRSSSYLRDDLTRARNNFAAVARSGSVYDRTIEALHLAAPDHIYNVDVRPVTDSDFVDLVFSTRTALRARLIADEHAAQALKYYGELRAKPAAAMATLLAAETARARSSLFGSHAMEASWAADAASTSLGDVTSSVEAQHARETYKFLLGKYLEAVLNEKQALRATYIQVVEPAPSPTPRSPLRTFAGLLGLTLVGSLGLGMLLALVLDSLFRKKSVSPAFSSIADATPLAVGHSG